MAKVNGPLMSLDASGTIANAITFSKWKGRNYVRERVIPSNPKSEAQVGRRSMFKFLTQAWDAIGAGPKNQWQDLADQLVASPFNAYVSENMKAWHNFLSPAQGTPRLETGLPSDRALTAAAWEENRIKISSTAITANAQWGILIFGSIITPIVESVGLTILALVDNDILAHDYYWTPPNVTTWYFNSMTFSDDGNISVLGAEQSAIP